MRIVRRSWIDGGLQQVEYRVERENRPSFASISFVSRAVMYVNRIIEPRVIAVVTCYHNDLYIFRSILESSSRYLVKSRTCKSAGLFCIELSQQLLLYKNIDITPILKDVIIDNYILCFMDSVIFEETSF